MAKTKANPPKTRPLTPRNEFGRTATEEAAWQALSQGLVDILNGTIKPSANSYRLEAINIGTGVIFSGRNSKIALVNSLIKGDTRYISAKEAIARKWGIKGAKQVFFRRPLTSMTEDNNGEAKQRQFFKSYGLFCLSDIEHNEPDGTISNTITNDEAISKQLLDAVAQITTLTRLPTHAHLLPKSGTINIPPANNFKSYRLLASTVLHELSHYVNRDGVTVKEYETYRGYEELCAEISALLCCHSLGLPFEPKNYSYIESWLEDAKRTHTDALEKAFSEASRRSDVVMGLVSQYSHLKYAA